MDRQKTPEKKMHYFYYIYIWVAYNLLDIITTDFGLKNGLVEANPLPNLILQNSSDLALFGSKLLLALLWLLAVVLLARRRERIWLALRIGNLLVFATVIWNFFLISTVL
jgi:hypothetical protein